MSNIKKNISLLFFVQVSNYVFPLLTLPFLARSLGVEQFGILALIQSVIQYCIVLTDYGFNLSATRRISIVESRDELNKVFSSTFYAKFFLVVLCYIFLIAISSLVPLLSGKKLLLSVLYLSVIGNVFFPIYLFQGLEKMKDIVWITILAKSISLVSVFVLVNDSSDVLWAAFSLALGMLSSGLLSFVYILCKNDVSFCRVSFKSIISTASDGFPFFLSNIAISCYTTMNVIVVGYFFPVGVVGNYSAAERIRMAGQSLYSPIQQVIYPRVNSVYKNNQGYGAILKKYATFLISLSILMSLFVFCFGYRLALWYLGDGYEMAATIFVRMSPLFVIIAISIVLGQWGLIVVGEVKKLSAIYTICAILHVLYLYPFICLFGVYGVVYSIILTEVIVCVCMASVLILRRKSIFVNKISN